MGPVMRVVTKAMMTRGEKSAGESIRKSSPTLSTTSSTRPLVLTNGPTARDSRQGSAASANRGGAHQELGGNRYRQNRSTQPPGAGIVQQSETGAEACAGEEERQKKSGRRRTNVTDSR